MSAIHKDASTRPSSASKSTNGNNDPRTPIFFAIGSYLALAIITGYFLCISWRKWPDPIVDFGRELYIPWQLSQGAVLYRDTDDFYGPLAQYFNSALFSVFGPGLMVLVFANLVIFACIVICILRLFRGAWGPGAALACGVVFVSVFGFSQLTSFANYNYATPYSHEATHGLLVCLLLVGCLKTWVHRPTAMWSFGAGLLLGLTAVLKVEIMLAGACISLAALYLSSFNGIRMSLGSMLAWLAGAILPSAVFVFFFWTKVPFETALGYAGRAWLNVILSDRFTSDPSQIGFLGLDQPMRHLLEHGTSTLAAVLVIGAVCLVARFAEQRGRRARILVACALALALTWLGSSQVPWEKAGQALLGLLLIYLGLSGWAVTKGSKTVSISKQNVLRLLLAVLAVALMARMILAGRLHQFGFYQAAIGALVITAVLLEELPATISASSFGRYMMTGSFFILIACGTVTLVLWSQQMLAMKTYPVGEGADRFFAFDPRVERTGEFVRTVSTALKEASGGNPQTVLVLPDGEMINYLARMRSPVSNAFFFSSATVGGREALIVSELETHPPDWVVIISRDLREFGVDRYGNKQGQGREIISWARRNYGLAATLGGDPLNPTERGVMLLARRSNQSPRPAAE